MRRLALPRPFRATTRLPFSSMTGCRPERSSSGLITSRIRLSPCGSASSMSVCGLGVCTSLTSSRLISSYWRFFSISFFAVPASMFLYVYLSAGAAEALRDDDQDQTDDAHDDAEGAHRPQVAVHVKMIQQRAAGLGPGRVEKDRGADPAKINRGENDQAGDKPGRSSGIRTRRN